MTPIRTPSSHMHPMAPGVGLRRPKNLLGHGPPEYGTYLFLSFSRSLTLSGPRDPRFHATPFFSPNLPLASQRLPVGAKGSRTVEGRWAPSASMGPDTRMQEAMQDGTQGEAGDGLRLRLLVQHKRSIDSARQSGCFPHGRPPGVGLRQTKLVSPGRRWAPPLENKSDAAYAG